MVIGSSVGSKARLMFASLAFATFSLASLSAHAAEPSIWYRTSEGCPDGASFLERLERRSVRGRLAAVGDHVDFVVTLGVKGQRSSGRLERQTSGGTIAIREVEDVRCEAVADALALSLALALEPPTQEPQEAAPSAEEPAPVPESPPPASPAAAPAEATLESGTEPDVAADPPVADAADDRVRVRLGAAIGAWDLFQGRWLFEAGPFGEIEAPSSFVLPHASVRVVLQGGLRADADASAEIFLMAARLEACPLALGWGPLSLRPCAALDAGAIGASAAEVVDTALWSAVGAHARVRFERGWLGLEAQAGGIIPITHYEVTAAGSGAILEETRAIGFAGGLGISIRVE